MKETIKSEEVEEEIAKFKKQFQEKHGIKLIVLSPADNINRLTIPEAAEIINRHLVKYSALHYKKPAKKKSRREDTVIHSQAFCKICKDLNYGPSEIARFLDKDHSTVIYSIRKASDLLSINDNRFLTVYNSVKKEIINKMYGRDIQYSDSE
jgi:chromosomal replication initiation ATPase DnaA